MEDWWIQTLVSLKELSANQSGNSVFCLMTYWSRMLFQRKDPNLYVTLFKQPQSYAYVISISTCIYVIYIYLHVSRVTLSKEMSQNLEQLSSRSPTKTQIKVVSSFNPPSWRCLLQNYGEQSCLHPQPGPNKCSAAHWCSSCNMLNIKNWQWTVTGK